jgi:uncharacterized membrane protein YuzA (DUF378 family)
MGLAGQAAGSHHARGAGDSLFQEAGTARPAPREVEPSGGNTMKGLDIVSLILVIIGAIVWGLIGLFGWNLVDAIFGAGSVVARIIYIIIGLAGLWQLMPLFRSMGNSSM